MPLLHRQCGRFKARGKADIPAQSRDFRFRRPKADLGKASRPAPTCIFGSLPFEMPRSVPVFIGGAKASFDALDERQRGSAAALCAYAVSPASHISGSPESRPRAHSGRRLLARLLRQIECPIHGVRIIRLPGHRFRAESTEDHDRGLGAQASDRPVAAGAGACLSPKNSRPTSRYVSSTVTPSL